MVQPETSKIFRNYDMCYQVYLFDNVIFSLKGIIVNKNKAWKFVWYHEISDCVL